MPRRGIKSNPQAGTKDYRKGGRKRRKLRGFLQPFRGERGGAKFDWVVKKGGATGWRDVTKRFGEPKQKHGD